MTDFKVGDKVRYVGQGANTLTPGFIGLEGIISEVFGYSVTIKVTKSETGSHIVGSVIHPFKTNLELIEDYTFNDIRAGDHIRRVILRPDGSKVIWEGVAHRLNYDGTKWLSKEDYHLYYKLDDLKEDTSLELVERPEPPHWSDEKPVGSMFLYGKGKNKALWKKTTETNWTRTFLINNVSDTYRSHEITDLNTEDQEWLK
jgi:hypothetical protein